ncbi:HNH endonuclease [Stenotrophomonas maltophilia]|uniref:HNH endonuclease n=1 Tax=Stenotrophomonas maltophilia TaxID=40324 RepID=UPI0015DE31B5|nr:hypothetical protein [Stenotrophomonas maltophilia]
MAKTWIRRSLREQQKGLCAYCDAPLPGRAKSSLLIPVQVGGSKDAGIVLACNECLGSKSQSDLAGWLAMPFHRVLPKNVPGLLVKRAEAAEQAQNHELPVAYSVNRKTLRKALEERWKSPRVRVALDGDILVFDREQHGRGAALAVLRSQLAAVVEERASEVSVRVPAQHLERAKSVLAALNCWVVGLPTSGTLGELKRAKKKTPVRGISKRQRQEMMMLRDTDQLTTLGRADVELTLLKDAYRRLGDA